MRTDRLIDILSTNLEPVKRGQAAKTLAGALALGGVAAFCVMAMTVGLRADLADQLPLRFLILKLLFALSVIGVGAPLLIRSMRPGRDTRTLLALVVLPFVAVALAGVVALTFERSMAWREMLLGTQWAGSLICIPLFAVIPFAVLIWALRQGAPTNLERAGMLAGLVAGALGAAAYALHCPDDSLPFIAIWYVMPIALCAAAGAVLGPRLLRW